MIIERRIGYTNEMMLDYCNMLDAVVSKTVDVKTGRAPKIQIVKKPKYKYDETTKNKIKESIEYYSKPSFDYRPYQLDIINRGYKIIMDHGFLYLTMEVRTGKTLTSFGIADRMNVNNVLFITKKKAISTIQDDYDKLSPNFKLTIINYESLHTVMDNEIWDLIICDEAHSMGAFPKPSARAKLVHDLVRNLGCKVILLSGTPTPESYSQMYHQVYGIRNNPFKSFTNFYRFADIFVKVKQKKVNGMLMNDYSNGLDTILEAMEPYSISYTQAQAGFVSSVQEHVLEVEMKPSTMTLIDRLKRDLVIEGKDELILADTPVKLMMKVHQLCSGTIKFESGKSMVLDTTKAEFIRSRFANEKIGIFYKFKEELSALQSVFGDDLTTDIDEFNETKKNIALQIVSGREGISLKMAKYLVYYNIDFSATSYWQSKDRMTTKERAENEVFWVFSKGGIEMDIYKTVTKKRDFTLSHFKKLI